MRDRKNDADSAPVPEHACGSRRMLQLVLDTIPVRVFWKDRAGYILGCNRPFALDAGFLSPSEVVGKTDYDMGWRDQAELYRADDQQVMATGQPKLNYEEPQTTPDGRTIWLRTSKIPLRNARGKIIGILGTYEDITERKQAEEALRKSEERFRSLVETTSDWMWETDAHGVYTYASPRVKDLLGYEPTEVIGMKPTDLMPPDEASRLEPLVLRIFEESRPITALRNWNLRKDGGLVLLETNGLPVLDDEGNLIGYRGIDRDITERERTAEALKESENRYAAAQRAANIGSWDWNIRTGELYWSEQIEPMFGFAPGSFPGTYQAFLDCIHPEDRDFVIASVDAAVHGRGDYRIEHRIIRPDGTVRWLSETGEVHRDEEGMPVRMFGIVQDVTERKLAEQERERLLAQIDQAKENAQRQFALLQQALLPSAPSKWEGYEIAVAYIPASPGQEIGGDFYDTFVTQTSQAGVLVGDVTGKDIYAASLAAVARGTIRAFAYQLGAPGEALEHANELICAQEHDLHAFVTAFLAIVELDTGSVRYATAGHPPPAVWRTDGSVQFLELGSMPVAVCHEQSYAEHRLTINPGDKLVVYTDGISEARREGRLFDLEGIRDSLVRNGHRKPQQVLDALVSDAKDWALGHLTDDVVLVVIERLPQDRPA